MRIVGTNRGFGLNAGRYSQLTRPVWQELRNQQQALDGTFAWGTVTFASGSAAIFAPPMASSSAASPSARSACDRIAAVSSGLPTDTLSGKAAVVSYDYWHARWEPRSWAVDPPAHQHRSLRRRRRDASGILWRCRRRILDIAQPMCQPNELRREVFDIAVMGRLRPGWTIERASAHFDALSAGIFDAMAPAAYGPQATAQFKSFRLAAYSVATGVSSLRTRYEDALHFLFAITALFC